MKGPHLMIWIYVAELPSTGSISSHGFTGSNPESLIKSLRF